MLCCRKKAVENVANNNKSNVKKIIELENTNFKELRIGTLDASLDQTIYKNDKISAIVELLNDLDILCLQNIADMKTTKTMIKQIYDKLRNNIYFYPSLMSHAEPNILNRIAQYEKSIKNKNNDDASPDGIEYMSSNSNNSDNTNNSNNTNNTMGTQDVFRFTFTKSTDEYTSEFQNITISKYPIVNGATLPIGNMFNIINYASVININYKGTIVSVYNAALQIDFTGISNKKIREMQIMKLYDIIDENRKFIKTDETFNEYYISDINFLCCDLNIMEYKNNVVNEEFVKCLKTLKGLDLFKFVKKFTGNNTKANNEQKTTKHSYVMLILPEYDFFEVEKENFNKQILTMTDYLYDKYKLVVKRANTKKNLDYGANYPTSITLLIDMPKESKVVETINIEVAIKIND